MDAEIAVALLAGGFALAGGTGGVILTSVLAQRADARRLNADDERRWLADRRVIYARYLSMAEALLTQIDAVAVFLPYDGTKPISDEDEAILSEGLVEYFMRWDDDLQPALFEVQLIAGSPTVSDLADRVSGALMEITSVVELRGHFVEYYPDWFRTRDLVAVLRNAMRVELNLPALPNRSLDDEWPWLADRPDADSYVQMRGHHPSTQPARPAKRLPRRRTGRSRRS